MNSLEGAKLAISALNAINTPYMIVGSLSSNFYAIPRSTRDADFVIESDECLGELKQRLSPRFVMEPQIGFETKLMTTKFVFNHRDTAFKLEVFLLSEDLHDRERFRRRVTRSFEDVTVFVPTAEDVIIQKLRWGRQKDRADVQDIIDVQSDRLDWPYIHQWCDRHGTRGLLDQIRAQPRES